ncbi:MAG: hypothetical protein DHS20C21_00080 [Gemmatimonadota bacterium]|nr:MAG: hypothetical protein DHS20C21_00080 [Gemmatimonadota bacterium]
MSVIDQKIVVSTSVGVLSGIAFATLLAQTPAPVVQDLVEAREIRVVNELGDPVVRLLSMPGGAGGVVSVIDDQGAARVMLAAILPGTGNASLAISDPGGTPIVQLGGDEYGQLALRAEGRDAVWAGRDDAGNGFLSTWSAGGKETVHIGSSKVGHGGVVEVYDTEGNTSGRTGTGK